MKLLENSILWNVLEWKGGAHSATLHENPYMWPETFVQSTT